METIRARVTTMVNKAPLPKKYGDKPHHLIAKLLEADQARSQEKQTPWGLLERACIQHAV